MKNYLAVFLGTAEALADYRAMDADKRMMSDKAGMEAWKNWAEKYKGSIIYPGAPLGKTKRIDKNGVSDATNGLGAYVVVQAESQDEAAKMFIDHPHFMIFPGDSVEVIEHLPIPGM